MPEIDELPLPTSNPPIGRLDCTLNHAPGPRRRQSLATRIHVTAVRGCPADEIREVFVGILGPAFAVDPVLAFLEEEPAPGPTRPQAPFDLAADQLADLGGPVPEEFRASVADLPYSQAMNRYREWHAERITSALAAAGIPHDPAAVRS